MINYRKWLTIVLIPIIAMVAISCSEEDEAGLVDDEKYTLLLDSAEKTWWVDPASIKTADLPEDEKILEVRLKIDHKEHEVIEQVKWYISAETKRYKSATVTIFNYDDRIVEQ